jgi:hypothetical protein
MILCNGPDILKNFSFGIIVKNKNQVFNNAGIPPKQARPIVAERVNGGRAVIIMTTTGNQPQANYTEPQEIIPFNIRSEPMVA